VPLTVKNTFIDLDDDQPAKVHTDGTQTCDASFFRHQDSDGSEVELPCKSVSDGCRRLLGLQEESSSAEVVGQPPVESLHGFQDGCPQTATAMPMRQVESPPPAATPHKLELPGQLPRPATTTVVLEVPIEVECAGDPALLQQALQQVEAVVQKKSVDPATGRLLLDLQVALGLPQFCEAVEVAQVSATASPSIKLRPLPKQADAKLGNPPLKRGTSPRKVGGTSPESSPASSPLVCCHWKNKGFCKFLDACKFQHPAHKRGIGLAPGNQSRVAAPKASAPRRTARPR